MVPSFYRKQNGSPVCCLLASLPFLLVGVHIALCPSLLVFQTALRSLLLVVFQVALCASLLVALQIVFCPSSLVVVQVPVCPLLLAAFQVAFCSWLFVVIQVAFCPLTSGEVSAACSTLSDQGLLQLNSQQGDRRCRVTLRVQEDDVLAAVVDNRLLSNCLSL